MKRLFKGHIYFGRIASIAGDEAADYLNEKTDVKPSGLRWFCGMHDLDTTITCQLL